MVALSVVTALRGRGRNISVQRQVRVTEGNCAKKQQEKLTSLTMKWHNEGTKKTSGIKVKYCDKIQKGLSQLKELQLIENSVSTTFIKNYTNISYSQGVSCSSVELWENTTVSIL